MSEYEDIINLKRPQNNKHKPMNIEDRAAQFAPFAALSGYSEEIEETGRLTDEKFFLSEEELEELNKNMMLLKENINSHPLVNLKYFEEDNKKEGGKYTFIQGHARDFDEENRILTLSDGTKINIDNIEKAVLYPDNELKSTYSK